MERTKIEGSSNIAEIGYDYDNKTLEIKFHSGGIYQYWPISPSGWDSFLKAESKGSFFTQHIKNNKGVNYRKLDDLQASK
jgi:hypothetical protein